MTFMTGPGFQDAIPETNWMFPAGKTEKPLNPAFEKLVKPAKTYVLRPGDSHFYDVGVVHSPRRDTVTKLVRIEGANLDRIKRSNIKAAEPVA